MESLIKQSEKTKSDLAKSLEQLSQSLLKLEMIILKIKNRS